MVMHMYSKGPTATAVLISNLSKQGERCPLAEGLLKKKAPVHGKMSMHGEVTMAGDRILQAEARRHGRTELGRVMVRGRTQEEHMAVTEEQMVGMVAATEEHMVAVTEEHMVAVTEERNKRLNLSNGATITGATII